MVDCSSSSRVEVDESRRVSSCFMDSIINPCYCIEVAVRSFLKCLGLDRINSKEPPSPAQEEEDEEGHEGCTQDDDPPVPPSTITYPPPTTTVPPPPPATVIPLPAPPITIGDIGPRIGRPIKRPPRPGVSSGRPGQIN